MTGDSIDSEADRKEEVGPGSGPAERAREEIDVSARADSDLARELRLRPEPPRVTRLSRRVLVTLGGTAAVGVSTALMIALWPHANQTSQELLSTENRGTPDGLNSLPRDYSGFLNPIPQLGPPLPGDLGRPMLNAGAPAPGMPQPTAPSQPDLEAQRLAQERARQAQELEAARTSRLFASEARSGAQAPAAGPAFGSPADAAGGAATPSSPQSASSSEGDRKLAFLNGSVDRRTTSLDRIQRPTSASVLQAGAVIPAAMLTGLRSDLPGQITAQVTEAVYDSPTGRILLIPQGARLIGQYDAQVSFGQSRALLVWNRLVFPNGRSIVLERQPGADPEGYAGLEDEVDNHWGQLFKAALLSTILSIGSEAGTSNDDNSLVQALRRGASDSISQTGRQVVGRSLQVQPTITVRPGFPVRVIVTRDLLLEPYGG